MVMHSSGVDLQIAETLTLGNQVEQSTVGWATGVCSPGAFGCEEVARSGEGSVIAGGTGNSIELSIGDKCVMEFC